MSISFSGLNSGIDTSSWVESLVALKNAKVTKLETEKESVVLSQETLNNIKSFFSSFRSLIEKVTDTKFNIASMDLFAQNLANSSNVSKVTASATTDAVEASYEINVNKLATNTKATSGVSYTTTIVTTTTATNNTYLTDLAGGGIKAGDIQVTNSLGATNTISITSKDTIGSLVEKFQGVGVDAYYSDTTGVFSLNIDTNNINDIGNTGIKDALHLSNVNSGYQSGTLNETNTETTWDNADSTTKLSAFGAKSGTMTIQSNGYEYSVTINDNTTIADFVQKLKNLGIDASYNDGELEINDIEISDEGTTNIINALGIEKESVSNTSISDNLNYQEEKIATIDDKISDFVSNSSGIVSICSANGEEIGQISVSESTTFGNLFEKLADYGISAYMDDGVISFAETNGNYLTGNLITALGIEVGTTAASTTSGLGVASNSTVTFQSVYSSNTTDYTTTVTTNTVTSTVGVAVSSGSQQTYNSVVTSETTDYTTTVTTNTVTSTVGIAVSSSSQISYTTVGTDTTVTGTTTNVETVVTDTTKGVGLTSATTINYSTVVYTPTTTDVTQVSTQLVTTTTPTLATYTIVNTETVVNANTVQFNTVIADATVKSVSGGITTYVTQTITYDTATTTPISSDFIGSVDRIDVTGLTKLSYVSNVTKGTYLISSTADLAAINNLTSTENIVLVQGRDIDMTDSTVRVTVTFAGTYDGNGYDIVNYTDTKGYGLFNILEGATIKNLGLRDFNITTGNGSYRTGALASSVYSADIENCYIKGLTVTNAENVAVNVNQSTVGGLVGYAMTINISKSYAEDVSISTTVVKNDANDKNYDIFVGGLVGNIASKGDISDCYAKNLSITTYQSDKLEDSSSKTGFTRIGGIAGFVQTTSISRTFAENVEIKNNVDTTLGSVGATAGGILGSAYGGGNITDCYVNNISIMAETTKSAIGVGGIAGDKYSGDISNCAVLNSSISYKCSADANYQTSSTLIFSVGGIVGHTSINNLINCYVQDTELNVSSTTSMPGKSGLGGLVGWWGEGNRSVIACYTSDVTMNANNSSSITTFAGGLVGALTNATGFKDSYVNGGSINIESSGTSYVGGLFGNAESPTVANCQVANLETSSATYKGLLAGIAYSMTVSDFSYVSSGNVSYKKMNGYYSSKTYNGATILENTTFAPDYTYDYETDYASYSNKSVVNTPYGVDGWINTINRRYSYSTVVYSTTTTTTTSTETQLENVVTTQTVKTTQTVQVTTTVPVTQTVSMTRDTTFYQLGLRGDSPQAFIGVYDGNTFTVGVNVTDSVDDIIEELSNYGINTSVRGGKFYISSSGSGYLTDIQDGICTILSLDEENNPLYTVQTSTTYVTTTVPTTETIAGATTTVLMNGSSTMAQLGLDNSTPQYIQGVANGRAFTIAIDTTDTVDEIINALEDVGLPASVRSGKIYIANSDTSYITGMSDGVKNALGFGVDAGNNTTYSTITSTTYDTTVTGSTRAVYTTVTETMTGASTMAQLGLASSNNQYIKGVANGREFTITVDTTDTVDELIDALEDVGLPASVRSGKLYIANSDTSYITGISDGVKNALGINVNAGEDTTYSTVTNMTYDTTVTSSTRVVYTTVTETMTGASTMGQLGLENSDNQYIKGVANGREFSLVISTTDKIDEIIDALGDVGIPASVRSGKLYIANSDTSYITGMSEGVQNALGISGTLGENKTYSIVNNNTYETTITGSTRVV
jgi:hypothetical protein